MIHFIFFTSPFLFMIENQYLKSVFKGEVALSRYYRVLGDVVVYKDLSYNIVIFLLCNIVKKI